MTRRPPLVPVPYTYDSLNFAELRASVPRG
jgi:hypothetical protein